MSIKTPIVLFVFNRLVETERCLSAILKAEPEHLLVFGDGPRAGMSEEADVLAVRRMVDSVRGPSIEKHFSEENMGCRRRIQSALDFVFERHESAILLEDDCIADPTFFPFCEELLGRYLEDQNIWGVSGANWFPGRGASFGSYYFSRWLRAWGWATWARAWKAHDRTMMRWPELRDSDWHRRNFGSQAGPELARVFDQTKDGRIDTWDYQFMFSVLSSNGLIATPGVNLVSNIGTGPKATHTSESGDGLNVPTEPIGFPLRHPTHIERVEIEDLWLTPLKRRDSETERRVTTSAQKRGVLYLIYGDAADAALERSLHSLEQVHPELDVETIRLDAKHPEGLLEKSRMGELSPFETTVFLDCDTVVLGKLDFLFEQAERWGLTATICESPWARRYQAAGLPRNAIEMNTGVVGWNAKHPTVPVAKFFAAWKRLAKELDSSIVWLTDQERLTLGKMGANDQASFTGALLEVGINPAAMPVNWNLRPGWIRTFFGPVHIWHDYSEPPPQLREWARYYEDESSIIQFHSLDALASPK